MVAIDEDGLHKTLWLSEELQVRAHESMKTYLNNQDAMRLKVFTQHDKTTIRRAIQRKRLIPKKLDHAQGYMFHWLTAWQQIFRAMVSITGDENSYRGVGLIFSNYIVTDAKPDFAEMKEYYSEQRQRDLLNPNENEDWLSRFNDIGQRRRESNQDSQVMLPEDRNTVQVKDALDPRQKLLTTQQQKVFEQELVEDNSGQGPEGLLTNSSSAKRVHESAFPEVYRLKGQRSQISQRTLSARASRRTTKLAVENPRKTSPTARLQVAPNVLARDQHRLQKISYLITQAVTDPKDH